MENEQDKLIPIWGSRKDIIQRVTGPSDFVPSFLSGFSHLREQQEE